MLSRTFNLPAVGFIEKHKHELVNPKIIVPVRTRKNKGYTVELTISIPEGYSFLDDITTYGEFLHNVKTYRRISRFTEEIYEVSQLEAKEARLAGGHAGIVNGWSKGQVMTVSFLNEKDMTILDKLQDLMLEKPNRETRKVMSRLASVLKRSAFITDDDGIYSYFRDYYRESLPMFNIVDIKRPLNTFHFNHFKLIA